MDQTVTIEKASLWTIGEQQSINDGREYYIVDLQQISGKPVESWVGEHGIPLSDSCEFVVVDEGEASKPLSPQQVSEYSASRFGLGQVVLTTRLGKATRVELEPLEE